MIYATYVDILDIRYRNVDIQKYRCNNMHTYIYKVADMFAKHVFFIDAFPIGASDYDNNNNKSL